MEKERDGSSKSRNGEGEGRQQQVNEEGWQKVRDRRRRGTVNQQPFRRNPTLIPSITFFVSNLPLGCLPKDLVSAFQKYGTVLDAYVARKREKSGGIFGFVRFPLMQDVRGMERNLNMVTMGHLKVSVNVARFDRKAVVRTNGNRQEKNEEGEQGKRPSHINRDWQATWNNKFVSKGKSFKDAFLNNQGDASSKVINLNSFVSRTELLWGQNSLIGRAKDFHHLCCMGDLVKDIYGGPILRYLGGLDLMIQFNGNEEAMSFLKSTELWNPWLSTLFLWEGRPIPFERIAMINVIGVPPQLWDPMIFNQISESLGELIYRSEASFEDRNLSQHRMAVLTSCGDRINEAIKISWKDKSFVCWAVEDARPWVPEFVNGNEANSDDNYSVGGIRSGGEENFPEGDRNSNPENKVASRRPHYLVLGKSNTSGMGFSVGISTQVPKKWRRQEIEKRSRQNGNKSPVMCNENHRATKRTRPNIEYTVPIITPMTGWPLSLDLNNTPLSSSGGNIPLSSTGGNSFIQKEINSPHVNQVEDSTCANVLLVANDDGLQVDLEEGQIPDFTVQSALDKEVQETIAVAEAVGIHLNGLHQEVHEEIVAEGDFNFIQ